MYWTTDDFYSDNQPANFYASLAAFAIWAVILTVLAVI